MSEFLDHFAHAGDVDDLEYGIDILLVDLPDEGNLGREGMEGSEVDIGRAVSEDEGLVLY